MKNITLSFLLLIIFLPGCKKATLYCGVKEPINDLPWLKTIVADTTVTKIKKTTYKSEEGFFIDVCYNVNCTAGGSVYKDCSGNTVCVFGVSAPTAGCRDFNSGISYEETIYQR